MLYQNKLVAIIFNNWFYIKQQFNSLGKVRFFFP